MGRGAAREWFVVAAPPLSLGFRRETVVHLSSHLYADIADYVAPESCIILPNGIPDATPDSLRERFEERKGPCTSCFSPT